MESTGDPSFFKKVKVTRKNFHKKAEKAKVYVILRTHKQAVIT